MYFKTITGLQVPAISADLMRTVDTLMVDTYHIALLQMMENAGRNLADLCDRWAKNSSLDTNYRITVLTGPGGNGGGGLVAARHLVNRGHQVHITSATPVAGLSPVTAQQASTLKRMEVTFACTTIIPPCDLILDCLLGYSLDGNPKQSFATLIRGANSSSIPIIALDTPSGLDVTTGKPQTPCVNADVTMTLALPKSGFLSPDAQSHLGGVYLADISVPPSLYQNHLSLTVPTELFSDANVVPLTLDQHSK